jgi:hypothetical protein
MYYIGTHNKYRSTYILKYECHIELHGDFGNWFIRIEIVHNF